mmetsp:Transcript_57359/g.134723  ORF Transcript_57359/g.134723 Transcript_57359/m.134723 type:complete len:161 (-) Transcript_57359:171-653(-)
MVGRREIFLLIINFSTIFGASPCQRCGETGECTYLSPANGFPATPIRHEYCGKSNSGFDMCCPTQIDGLAHRCDKDNLGACQCNEKLCFTRDTLDTHPPYNAVIVPVLLICFFCNCALVWKNRKRQIGSGYGELEGNNSSTRGLVGGSGPGSESASQDTA